MGVKNLALQIIKFGGVGAFCTVIDFVILHILTEYCGINVLVSAAAAFTVSTLVNYILSARFVFRTDAKNNGRTFIQFIVLSVIGLAATEIIMKVGVDVFALDYMLVKVISTAIVMVFNFVTRKMLFVKNKENTTAKPSL